MAALIAAAAAPAPAIKLEPVAAKFFYGDSGKLSDNKLDKAGRFSGWNSVIGEGDAGGATDDALIIVSLTAAEQDVAVFADGLVTITATRAGKTLATRSFKSILIPAGGRSHSVLYLSNVGCAGRIDITAQFHKQVQRARLDMDCGE